MRPSEACRRAAGAAQAAASRLYPPCAGRSHPPPARGPGLRIPVARGRPPNLRSAPEHEYPVWRASRGGAPSAAAGPQMTAERLPLCASPPLVRRGARGGHEKDGRTPGATVCRRAVDKA